MNPSEDLKHLPSWLLLEWYGDNINNMNQVGGPTIPIFIMPPLEWTNLIRDELDRRGA